MIIGSHVHFGVDQLYGSVKEALSYGANALMLYTGAPQNTVRSNINDELIVKAKELMNENNISMDNVICHAPYIINLANNIDPSKYEFSQEFLRKELDRCLLLGVKYVVLHPGAALTLDRKYALDNIINALNNILKPNEDVTILLETMAGKGTELGINTDEVKYIIDHINDSLNIGVCLDTCHLNDSGVDLNNFDDYLDEFDNKIGLNRVKCVHINDSKNILGSHKDRHENIGYGTIGFNTLLSIINNPRLDNIPKILETPYIDKEYPPYKFEIEMIRNNKFNENLYNDVIKYYKEG